jgi:hypothetical protein
MMQRSLAVRMGWVISTITLCVWSGIAAAQDGATSTLPDPPKNLDARDHPWDGGEQIDLMWELSPGDGETVVGYRVYRSFARKSARQLELEEMLKALCKMLDSEPVDAAAVVEAAGPLIVELEAALDDGRAARFDFGSAALATIRRLETIEAATTPSDADLALAEEALDRLDDAIEKSELQKEDKEKRELFIKAAKAAVTKSMLGEDYEDLIGELSAEQLKQVREARAQAAEEAKAQYAAEIAAKGEDVRWKFVRDVKAGQRRFTVPKLDEREGYLFRVTAVAADGSESAPATTSSRQRPREEPFDGGRFPLFIITLILCGSVVLYIQIARSGKPLKVRKIAGLAAVDEAVGRATEMGRPVLFVPGIQDMNDIQTIAGITVLSRVSKTAAEYDAKVEVPTARSLVMTTARETVQASFLAAGRPDAYNEDLVYYVTDEQFGYVAYLQGMMSREKPAACFYMGTFFAESLILAETGNSIGAIQIAGTAMPAQLPFFVAACDYTLIGEEFFAASAYLSREPDQLGSLKGQDVGKVIVAIAVVIGVIMATLAMALGPDVGAGAWFDHAVDYFKNVILGS